MTFKARVNALTLRYAGPGFDQRNAVLICEGFGCARNESLGFLRNRTTEMVPALGKRRQGKGNSSAP